MTTYTIKWKSKRKEGKRIIKGRDSELHAKMHFVTYIKNKGKVPRTARIVEVYTGRK